jgi:hypothetical protein
MKDVEWFHFMFVDFIVSYVHVCNANFPIISYVHVCNANFTIISYVHVCNANFTTSCLSPLPNEL